MFSRSFYLVFLTLLGLQIAAHANPAEPDRTRVMPNRHEGVIQEPHILFTYVNERRKRRLTLDLYRPAKTKGKRPAIVMFFGGGWMNGRPGQFAALAQALTQRGYVCVVPQYRLSGEKPFPAAVNDCKAAIAGLVKMPSGITLPPSASPRWVVLREGTWPGSWPRATV